MASEAVAVTQQVVALLEALNISYVIGGSMASTAHGRIRATMDVDIVVQLEAGHVTPFIAGLGDEFYAEEAAIRDAIARQRSVNLIHYATMFKVDLFVAGSRSFDQIQLDRRQAVLLEPPDHFAYVATAEDTILAKLDWYRRGGESSERQWQDIQGILDVQGTLLDRSYLRQWAAVLAVSDLLEQAINDYENRVQPMDDAS